LDDHSILILNFTIFVEDDVGRRNVSRNVYNKVNCVWETCLIMLTVSDGGGGSDAVSFPSPSRVHVGKVSDAEKWVILLVSELH